MSVEHRETETEKHILVVQEKIGMDGPKALQKERQTVDLNLKSGEKVSLDCGFRCVTQGKDFVYGVVSKSVARKTGSFSPLRGWIVDEKNLKLVAVDDPTKVRCTWEPEGESRFPF